MKENPNSDESQGLVICDITVRNGDLKSLSDTAVKLYNLKSQFPKVRKNVPNSNLPDYFMEISPASIQLSRKLPRKSDRGYTKRKPITAWSSKSRANMVKRLFTLDYSPLFGDELRTPVMITLTYPGEWQSVAPDGKAAKRHIAMFRKRYEREFGEPLRGVWKQEFQRRGAPHTHILTSINFDLGLFQLWVSKAWSEIVNHQDQSERDKHLRAGTGVQAWYDFYRDKPYLIAIYFGKHASPSNGGVKDYQNRPPQQWIDAGSIGRFWGYWGIESLTVKVQIEYEDSLFYQRTLRRWNRANSKPKRQRVRRVNTKTGQVHYRNVTRRQTRMTHNGGFISVPQVLEMVKSMQMRASSHEYLQARKLHPTMKSMPAIPPSTGQRPQNGRFKWLRELFAWICRLPIMSVVARRLKKTTKGGGYGERELGCCQNCKKR